MWCLFGRTRVILPIYWTILALFLEPYRIGIEGISYLGEKISRIIKKVKK